MARAVAARSRCGCRSAKPYLPSAWSRLVRARDGSHVPRDILIDASITRGAPSRAASERARVRRPTWRRGVGRGSRSRYGRSVSRTLGAEILHPWENPVPTANTPVSATVSEAAVGSTTVNVLAGPTRLAAGPDARRGRPRREPVSRQPNSRILRSTRLNRVLTEIRIESDDCWDDVRRRPKREHFSRRNVGTFPESSTLPERERDCMQERHTRRLSRV